MAYYTVFIIYRFRVLQKIVKRRFVTNVTKTVTNHSNRVAVIDSNGSFSYNQIYGQAQLIASRLDAKPGMIFRLWVSWIFYFHMKWFFIIFLKSIKGDRFCFLVESGSGQGLMIHKIWFIWSYTEKNWLLPDWLCLWILYKNSFHVSGQHGSKASLQFLCV